MSKKATKEYYDSEVIHPSSEEKTVPASDLMQDLLASEGADKSDKSKAVVDVLEYLKTGISVADPVSFDSEYCPEYAHLTGDTEVGSGTFVRNMSFQDRMAHHKLIYADGRKKPEYNHLPALLWLVTKSACNFQGDLLFDHDNPEVLELLVGQGFFLEQLFYAAMTKNGYMTKPVKDLVKNSDTTEN